MFFHYFRCIRKEFFLLLSSHKNEFLFKTEEKVRKYFVDCLIVSIMKKIKLSVCAYESGLI